MRPSLWHSIIETCVSFDSQTQTQQWQSERKQLKQQLQQVRSQNEEVQARLEETSWSLCNRNGEMALLKSQLKDAQVLALATVFSN